MMTYNPLATDLLWLETQQTFPVLYREALLISMPKTSIHDFRILFVTRIKRAGLKVKIVQEHIILINGKYYVWITKNPVQDERQKLNDFLHGQDIARLGYILCLDYIPRWGCVQMSQKYLKQNQ